MAEVAGLALGIVGLVGIYSTILEVLDQVTTARNLGSEIQQHQTKLNTVKTSLRLWGQRTGIAENGNLLERHHSAFDDAETRAQVVAALACLQDAVKEVEEILQSYQGVAAGRVRPVGTDVVGAKRWFRTTAKAVQKSVGAGKKMAWSSGEAKRVKDGVESVRGFVGLLYEIAPPEEMTVREREVQIGLVMERNRGKIRK